MKNYNLRRLTTGVLATVAMMIATLSGCTKEDTLLGGNFTPADQGMKIGQKSLRASIDAGENYFTTRLYRTDSIQSSNISYGYIGQTQNDTFGLRTASFFSQYIPANLLNSESYEGFGFRPIFDSAMLYLSVENFCGDTNFVQRYEVFEITNNSFLSDPASADYSADSVFFPSFDFSQYIASEPAFTFSFPDQENGIYTTTSSFRLNTTEVGEEFIERLMLLGDNAELDDEIYTNDSEWVNKFKGLYIRPAASQGASALTSQGAIYAPKLESSGFGIYARNREPSDPSLIKDTVGMTYIFYYDEAKAGNQSINKVERNYEGSIVSKYEIGSYDNTDVAPSPVVMFEGMAGVASQISFDKDFFTELDSILETEQTEGEKEYTSLFFNQAKLMIYMEGIDGYNPSTIIPSQVTPWLNHMPSRLGLYLNYSNYQTTYADQEGTFSSLQGIADYAYSYESSYELDYGGNMNRSQGCYVMNISSYIQALWNSYLTAKKDADGNVDNIKWDDITSRNIYLAPTADKLFTLKYGSAQGQASADNKAPIRLELTYTMIR